MTILCKSKSFSSKIQTKICTGFSTSEYFGKKVKLVNFFEVAT